MTSDSSFEWATPKLVAALTNDGDAWRFLFRGRAPDAAPATLTSCDAAEVESPYQLPTWQEAAPGGPGLWLLSGATAAGYWSLAATVDAERNAVELDVALRLKTADAKPAIVLLAARTKRDDSQDSGEVPQQIGPWRIRGVGDAWVRTDQSDAGTVVWGLPTPSAPKPLGTLRWKLEVAWDAERRLKPRR